MFNPTTGATLRTFPCVHDARAYSDANPGTDYAPAGEGWTSPRCRMWTTRWHGRKTYHVDNPNGARLYSGSSFESALAIFRNWRG